MHLYVFICSQARTGIKKQWDSKYNFKENNEILGVEKKITNTFK